jgi:hypothetical protein
MTKPTKKRVTHWLLSECEDVPTLQAEIRELWAEQRRLLQQIRKAQRDRQRAGVIIIFYSLFCLWLLWR